jgi:hypothetical protein
LLICSPDKPLIGQALTKNGTDPTEVRNRIDINIAEVKFTSLGDYMGIGFSGDYALTPYFSIGMGIPLVYADLPDGKVYGVGDADLNSILQLHNSKGDGAYRRTALGLNLAVPSGDIDDGTGEGAFSLDGYVAVSYFLGDFYMITPLLESTHTFGEDSKSRRVHDLSLRVINTFSMIEGHWVEITPEAFWDLSGDKNPVYVVTSTLGIMLDDKWALAAEFLTPLAGDVGFNSIGRFSVRYLFN